MTIKDILFGYGVDFDTLTFKTRKGSDIKTAEEIKERLANDEFVVDGEFMGYYCIYGDEPNGYIELYEDDKFGNEGEARSASKDLYL